MWIAGVMTLAVALSPSSKPEDVYDRWRDYLAPKPSETVFEAMNWRGTFWSAVLEAHKVRKPILLWAMNGHPMACT
jgi:hypothetical protein